MPASHKIGVDVGGTKTEAVLLDCSSSDWADKQPDIIERVRLPTPSGSYDGIVNTIASLVRHVSRHIMDDSILTSAATDSVGVCTPGTEYGPDMKITNTNTRVLQDMPLRRDLQRALGCTVTIENDANCFALAEATLGAASQYDTVFGVIMGTGVGGGIVRGGRIYRGRTGMAGEWGHSTLHIGGNMCYCGRRGCVETYLSGPALERRWKDLTGEDSEASGIVPVLSASGLYGGSSNDSSSSEHLQACTNIGAGARIWLEETLENFGYALANVIDIMDPDAIVLGGGISNMNIWYDMGADSVRKKVFSPIASDIPILRNRLGDSAGVIGAACLI